MQPQDHIASRLQEVLIDGQWIANTNYPTLLCDLTWQEANKTIGDHHSIALLTYHISYYLGGLLDALKTGKLTIRDKFSFDMPEIKSQGDWQSLINQFNKNAIAFVAAVKALTPEAIEGPFLEAKYGSYRKNLEGVVEHSYYHMGQITLIKKLIRAQGE